MNKMVEIIEKVKTEKLQRKNPFNIGNGEYLVLYKIKNSNKEKKFKGVCENFCSTGLSAFWNSENNSMLLVDYKDILGLYPIK